MSPIDDELRAALHGRAATLLPSPDPLAGVENRARRMRRTRTAAAVAASALAVAAIAVVAPALTPQAARTPVGPASTLEASPPAPVDAARYALDPLAPWAPRGTAVDEGTRAMIQREYATRTRGSEVLLTPLFAQVDEPSARLEVVFLAQVDGAFRWGVAQSNEAGPEFLWDEPLADGAEVLAAALPGDEVGRLLVVTSPEANRVDYVASRSGSINITLSMSEPAPGVAVGPLEGDAATDGYEVWDTSVVRVRGDAPDLPGGPAPDPVEELAEPANLLDWPARGATLDPALEAQLLDAFAAGVTDLDGEPSHSTVRYRPLFTGNTDGGVRFTVGQAWAPGREARTVSLAVGGDSGEQFLLGPVTDPGVLVVAQVLCCQPGSSVDTLVVVPVPGTGQVLYDNDDTGELRPVGTGQDFLDGVVLLDRDPRADRDRLQLLDGDGDLDRPLLTAPVTGLLCGVRECG